MSGIYALMDTLLPFEWLHYTFMKNALIAILLLTPLFGMLGTMAVDNKMAFFSDALGHSALTGIAIGVVLGWQSQMSAMLLFGILWAVLITFVKHHSKMSADTIISVFSSTSIALGLVVLSRGGAFAKYSSVLVGDVLSVAQSCRSIWPAWGSKRAPISSKRSCAPKECSGSDWDSSSRSSPSLS